jgi:hypothetical protein
MSWPVARSSRTVLTRTLSRPSLVIRTATRSPSVHTEKNPCMGVGQQSELQKREFGGFSPR